MLNSSQINIIKKLVRKEARILRGEKLQPLRLMNSLVAAREAHVPEHFLLPFSSVLERIMTQSHFDPAALPPIAGSLLNKNRLCKNKNLAALGKFASRIQIDFNTVPAEAVLAGESAALAGLYNDPGAFPVTQFSALLMDGTYINGDRPVQMASPSGKWSESIDFGGTFWRIPGPDLLIALFARHVGDPAIAPTPPMWSHLGTALLLWKGDVAAGNLLQLGGELGRQEEVERGLAIAAHIFPELEKWADMKQCTIPRWELKYAIPLAARRIVTGERD